MPGHLQIRLPEAISGHLAGLIFLATLVGHYRQTIVEPIASCFLRSASLPCMTSAVLGNPTTKRLAERRQGWATQRTGRRSRTRYTAGH